MSQEQREIIGNHSNQVKEMRQEQDTKNAIPAIEKVPMAAKRMCVSVTQVYREAHAGRLKIIKIGPRGSAVSTADVDKWILDRINSSTNSNNVSDTQAGSGANNPGSSASDTPCNTPPAEGAVVVEQPTRDTPAEARSDVNQHQPEPVRNQHPAIWPLVITDMAERDTVGRQRYVTPLQPFNGRDALIDAYQEALDLCVYLRQAIYERDKQ